MKRGFSIHAVVEAGLLLAIVVAPAFARSEPNDPNRYLNAVREFADNVLKYGRDTYGPKHTPLFVDGVNVRTHEPVKWISPKGDVFTATETEEWILSNFASQQTLLRTLDGLSAITGDAKYRDAAKETIRYAFEHLRAPNGLLYWGEVTAYDALGDKVRSYKDAQSLKVHYPYYELMWEVNPEATKQLIEAYWSAHIIDWSNLDFNRSVLDIGTLAVLKTPWDREYKGGPTFFKSKVSWASGVFATGTSLAHAATTHYLLSGQQEPLIWSKRLLQRFVDARHPNSGISPNLYNRPQRSFVGGGMEEHFSDPRVGMFPINPFVHPVTKVRNLYQYEEVEPLQWLSVLLMGEALGEQGKEYTQWAREELTAWGRASYRAKDNGFMPILTDGTSIEGIVLEETCPGAPKGSIAEPVFADAGFFWAYATAYKTTGDTFIWQMTRDIALGNSLGDIGKNLMDIPKLSINTQCTDAYSLLGFLELYAKTQKPECLLIAQRIGDNILAKQCYRGFFVPNKRHVYTRFDCCEPLALLHLIAALTSQQELMPRVWPSSPHFVAPYRYKEQGIDWQTVYTLAEAPVLSLSLQEVAAIGDVNAVRALIENGAYVDNVEDAWQKTALHRAVISGHKDVVELLLAQAARIDAKDGVRGATALAYAVEYGHRDVVELLLAHGADVNVKNNDGRSPIDVARRSGNSEIVELLQAAQAETSIHVAASQGMLAKVESFLENGVDINAKDDQGMTSLHLAAQGGHREVVEFLLSKDADINAQNSKGYTPLYSAIWNNDPNMVGLLVSKGADVNFSPEDDYSPLHHAVWMENLEIVKALVDNGADCDVKDQDGWTAFRYAADEANREIIALFVANGADVSGIHRAACLGNIARVEALLDQGTDIDEKDEVGWTPLYWACSMGQEAVGECLLSKGAQADAKTEGENTPLQAACYSGAYRLVELLVSKGADVNAKDKSGRTPLHSAATVGSREIVELLIEKGADVNAKNRANWTALHRAAIGGHTDVAKLLISHGADTTVEDSRGRTALQWAEQRGHTEIAELLHNHTKTEKPSSIHKENEP